MGRGTHVFILLVGEDVNSNQVDLRTLKKKQCFFLLAFVFIFRQEDKVHRDT